MKTIGVVDLTNGNIADRPRDTLTLDIPHDLDWATGGVSIDATSLAHYFASGGERLTRPAKPSRLFRRTQGDECLVADELLRSAGDSDFRRYRLSMVEPQEQA